MFLECIEEGEEYLNSYPEQNQFNSFFNYDLGCGEIRHSYIAHVDLLLPAWRQQLKDNMQLREQDFRFENLDAPHMISGDGHSRAQFVKHRCSQGKIFT